MARDELYSVVGRDRLPTYEDQDSLPYIEAIFRECMRWMPVLPLGVTHSVIEDDVYGDYFIPSGTGIIPVCTSSHHASCIKNGRTHTDLVTHRTFGTHSPHLALHNLSDYWHGDLQAHAPQPCGISAARQIQARQISQERRPRSRCSQSDNNSLWFRSSVRSCSQPLFRCCPCGTRQLLIFLNTFSICPGRHFAKDSAFLVIASILHAFEILPSIDENGNELDPTPRLEGSIAAYVTSSLSSMSSH